MIDFKDRSVQYPNRYKAVKVPGTVDIIDLIPAPGEINEEGTFVAKRAAQLLQADRRTYPVKSGQTIHAGDVVDVVGGEAGKTWVAEANVGNMLNHNAATGTATLKLNTQYSVVALLHPSGDQHTTLVDNTSGRGVVTIPFYSGVVTNVSLARLSDTKFVVGYIASNALKAKLGYLSNGTILIGSEHQLSASTTTSNALIQLSETLFFSVYNRSGLKAKLFPVESTNIILTGPEASLPGNTSSAYISATRLPDIDGNKRVCVCFADGSDGNKGKAVIATIKPDNTVEWGSAVTFEGLSIASYQISCKPSDTDIVVAYAIFDGSNYYIRAKILLANGSVLQDNDPITISKGSWVVLGKLGEALNISYDASSIGKSAQLKRSGDTLLPGEEYTFEKQTGSNPTVKFLSADAITNNRLLLSYADAGNSNYGTATILTVQGDQIAGSFTDASSDCIALQDATSGQPCEVIFDGVAELPGIAAGTEINSPGVYGYCPEDGRVWVRPEWDNGIVTGSYMGTGAYGSANPTVIRVGFEPSLVMVCKNEGDTALMINPCPNGMFMYSTSSHSFPDLAWLKDGLSFYASDAANQLNYSEQRYRFIAFKKR